MRKLEKLHMEKTLSNKLFLKNQLLNLRMKEGGDVMENLNEFNHCVNNLLRVEVKYEKEVKALLCYGHCHYPLSISDHTNVWQEDSLVRGCCPRHHFSC